MAKQINWHRPSVGWWIIFFLTATGWEAVFHARASGQEVRATGETPKEARTNLETALASLPEQRPTRGRYGSEDYTTPWVDHRGRKVLGWAKVEYVRLRGRTTAVSPPEGIVGGERYEPPAEWTVKDQDEFTSRLFRKLVEINRSAQEAALVKAEELLAATPRYLTDVQAEETALFALQRIEAQIHEAEQRVVPLLRQKNEAYDREVALAALGGYGTTAYSSTTGKEGFGYHNLGQSGGMWSSIIFPPTREEVERELRLPVLREEGGRVQRELERARKVVNPECVTASNEVHRLRSGIRWTEPMAVHLEKWLYRNPRQVEAVLSRF